MRALEEKGWTPARMMEGQLEGNRLDNMHKLFPNWARLPFRYIRGHRDKPKLEVLCPGQLVNIIQFQYSLTQKDLMVHNFAAYEGFLDRSSPPPSGTFSLSLSLSLSRLHIHFLSFSSLSLTRSLSPAPPPVKLIEDKSVRCIGGMKWRDFHPETWVLPNRAAQFFFQQGCQRTYPPPPLLL